ncbi:MAG TPA: zinc ribbon domain-containing protein [Candidatus Agathobaculum pullistercoris]|nr:zinc ribbon domain-containing protein [uncultured Agathobaculum sp.]HIX11883.1 zinc ribbon domain-containing protein [Candidatus Agathobaculum pullistercoris]
MKREELRQWFVEWLDDYYDELHSEDDLTPEVAESVLTALRPVSREQVEKVWKGEWVHKRSPYDYKIFVCKKCGKQISIQGENMDFCPFCGAAQTDEAVEMVMERLEALHSETKTD